MADDAGSALSCPWCSASLPSADLVTCPACGARLLEDEPVNLPGVTAIDPAYLAAAAAPGKVKRGNVALKGYSSIVGSLLNRDDPDNPPPSDEELPALAPPDVEVRTEMLRLELEARLAALQAEANALASEGGKLPDALALAEPPAEQPEEQPAGHPGGDEGP